jgi:hypothetical protein
MRIHRYPCNRPLRPIGLWDIVLDSRLTDDSEAVSLTRWPPFTRRKISGIHFCYRLSRPRQYMKHAMYSLQRLNGRLLLFRTTALLSRAWSYTGAGVQVNVFGFFRRVHLGRPDAGYDTNNDHNLATYRTTCLCWKKKLLRNTWMYSIILSYY